jgi:hypothetical protein
MVLVFTSIHRGFLGRNQQEIDQDQQTFGSQEDQRKAKSRLKGCVNKQIKMTRRNPRMS